MNTQIDELLGEVRPAYQRAGALELVLRRLQGLFGSIPSVSPLPLAKAVEHLKKQSQGSVKIPFADPAPKGDVQYKFAFEKPAAMHLIGSWPLRSAAKRPDGLDVDIAVVMPSTIFQEKDHMNYRYFHKRAYYLAVLAAAIRSAEGPSLGVDPSYQLLDGDARRTVLVLSPVHDRSDTDFSSLKCRIRIHLAHEAGLFPPTRLAPSRNSVRVGGGNAEESSSSLAPTPRYNGAVLLDSLHLAHLVYLHATAKACPAFADACLLLKTWAFQRGFGSGTRDKFRSSSQSRAGSRRRLVAGTGSARFLLTMVLAHLLNGEEKVPGKASTNRSKLANGFSSYQLFRGVVDWLGTHDFVAQPVFMKAPVNASVVSNGGKFAREDFAAQFERVFVDPTGSVNLLSSMPASGLELLQQEARQTFAMLNDAETDHFGALFLQDRSAPFFAFDETALVQFPLNKDDAQKNEPAAATRRADFGSILHIVTHDASATVTKALGTRAKLATLLTYASEPSLMTWPLDASRPGADGQLELGITLDPEHAHRLVDHGPTAEDTAGAEKFRAFWGPLAELRRFRDGRIMESVVWEIRGPFDRPAIPRRLVRHILSRHHGVSDEQISFFAEPFAGLVDVHPSLVDRTYLASPAEKGFQLIQAAYDDLARQLRSIEDLPLSLINVRPCSAGLRQTSTFVTGSLNLEGLGTRVPDVASYLPVQDIVLTFESSGRWPDDLAAIQKMKVAFYEKLCVSLSTKLQGARASVVYDLDAGASDIQDEAALELVLPTGFAFRARIHHDRERVLLERIVADKRAETPSRRRTAQAALQRWLRRFVLLPQHHAAIATLQHRFVALSLTIRLVKRWLAAQMLSPHLPEELIELICVATFLSPETGPPSSGPAGFVRVLQLLSTWRWREDALVVPLFSAAGAPEGGESVRFPTDKRAEALEAFTLARKTDPALNHRAWFVVTEEDTQGTAWGRDAPFAGAADGVTGLAKAACALLDVGPRLGEVEIKVSVFVLLKFSIPNVPFAFAYTNLHVLSASYGQSLFTPPLSHYDFLIHLSPSILPRYVEAVLASPSSWSASPPSSSASKKYKNHPDSSADLMLPSVLGSQPRAGFDPATEFVGLLTVSFDFPR